MQKNLALLIESFNGRLSVRREGVSLVGVCRPTESIVAMGYLTSWVKEGPVVAIFAADGDYSQ